MLHVDQEGSHDFSCYHFQNENIEQVNWGGGGGGGGGDERERSAVMTIFNYQ